MKTKYLPILAAVAAAAAFNSIAADAVLSPRAEANKIRTVPGKTEAVFGSVELGAAARFKALGGHNVVASSDAQSPDLVRGSNDLGVAAKAKASGGHTSGAAVQVAPLK